jgi:hypothetical protein
MNTYFLSLLKVNRERRKYKIHITIIGSWIKRRRWTIWSNWSNWSNWSRPYKCVSFSIFISKYQKIGVIKEGENWNLDFIYYDAQNPDDESNSGYEPYPTKGELNFHIFEIFKGKNFLLRVDDSWLPGVVALLS